MLSHLSMIVCSLIAADVSIHNGTHLRYEGSLVADKVESFDTKKQFTWDFVFQDDTDGLAVTWVLNEQGRGSWPWTGAFGRLQVDSDLTKTETVSGARPSLCYEREGGTSVVPLPLPWFSKGRSLRQGTSWTEDRWTYEVEGARKIEGHDCWSVAVSNPYGRRRRLWVDRSSSLIVAYEANIFVGQGEQHQLRYQLVSQSLRQGDSLSSTLQAFQIVDDLRARLEADPSARVIAWDNKQLSLLKSATKDLQASSGDPFFGSIAVAAQQDQKAQQDRSGALRAMRTKLVGRAVPAFQLKSLAGDTVDSKDFKSKVTVLHFWQYKDAPLEPPYGQVGYLDFLRRNAKDEDLDIYGVHVDKRLSDAERGKSIASAKKLRSFMNLSYPILLDDGAVLKSMGDPRSVGAELPLYVVIGRDGKVAHYRSGLYEIDRDRGLKELGEIVKQALAVAE